MLHDAITIFLEDRLTVEASSSMLELREVLDESFSDYDENYLFDVLQLDMQPDTQLENITTKVFLKADAILDVFGFELGDNARTPIRTALIQFVMDYPNYEDPSFVIEQLGNEEIVEGIGIILETGYQVDEATVLDELIDFKGPIKELMITSIERLLAIDVDIDIIPASVLWLRKNMSNSVWVNYHATGGVVGASVDTYRNYYKQMESYIGHSTTNIDDEVGLYIMAGHTVRESLLKVIEQMSSQPKGKAEVTTYLEPFLEELSDG